MAAPTIDTLTRSLQFARRQKAFAWAKYYEEVRTSLRADHRHLMSYSRVVTDDAIPEHIKADLKEMATALKKKWECPICLGMIDDGELDITNCGHYYCKPCLAQLKQTQKSAGKPKWECAVCRRKHGYSPDE
jgi:hypothetical protein